MGSFSLRGRVFLSVVFCTVAWLPTPSRSQVPGPSAQPIMPPVLLQMARNSAVWTELKLTPSQITQLQQVLDGVDGDWWRSRNAPPAEQAAQQAAFTATVKKELEEVLDDSQRRRLWQLERQALGVRMLLLDDVASTLRFGTGVRQRLVEIALKTDQRGAEMRKQIASSKEPKPLETALQQLQADEQGEMLKELSRIQRQQIGKLRGERFDFTKIHRTLPRAPELVDADATWLQGVPTARRLSDLRGKVVVVHFYAFQCINCKRNLPHYFDWHRDYADQELVVIGIQTPETSSERDPAKVTAAVEAEKIEYPVLLDTESSNWKNWGTTMWPTVYLIDRDGYLRTWWQGELNWQGATGEQDLRRQIEELLAEPIASHSPSAPTVER